MSQKSLNVTWHDHLQHLSGLFQDLYENKKLVDVTIYCTGGSLKAHKIVLSACSPYFAKIFQEVDIQHPVIILKGISLSEMHQLLEFMYKGSINILENELDSLIQAGSYLEIKGMDAKNIPSNMKTTAKRPAQSPIETPENKRIKEHRDRPAQSMETPEIKRIKEHRDRPTQFIETPENKRIKEHREEVSVSPSPPTPIKKDDDQNQTKDDQESEQESPNKENPDTTPVKTETSVKTEPTHGRQTRFKGQKRVDVTMFTKKAKMYEDLLPASPKLTKKTEKTKSTDPKKLNTSGASTSKKDTSVKKLNNSKTDDDSISKLVIKDVHSVDEVKTSTPKPKPIKKEIPDDTVHIPITPDIMMDSDDDQEGDDTHFDDDEEDDNDEDGANGYGDDEADSDMMLKPNNLECRQCRKTYLNDEEFSEHMKIHKKSLKCDYCDSYFQRKSHLIRHRRTHTGEKPFSCRECGKCFSRQDKLKAHIRVHDENEYKPPAHLKKLYDPPIPYYDEKRGRGRPRKNPFPCLPIGMGDNEMYMSQNKPVQKRPPGEQVENYDITNLPFGDFSYLTSSLPDFSDLTIIPVSCTSKSETDVNSSSSIKDMVIEPETTIEEEQISSKEEENSTIISPVRGVSIIKMPDKDESKISSNNEVTIINLNNEEEKKEDKTVALSQLGDCTIEAVPQ